MYLNYLNSAFVLYLFTITTQFVYYFFDENIFVITVYWGLLAFSGCGYGIQKNIIKYRTLGLYILSLTVLKILIYDVWVGLSGAVMRIFALMLVGVLMIVISVLYSGKYGDDLKGEFDSKNFFKR